MVSPPNFSMGVYLFCSRMVKSKTSPYVHKEYQFNTYGKIKQYIIFPTEYNSNKKGIRSKSNYLYRYSDFESDSDEDSEISFFKSSSSVERDGEAALKFKL